MLIYLYSKPNNNSTFQDSRKNELFVDIIEKLTGVINADVSTHVFLLSFVIHMTVFEFVDFHCKDFSLFHEMLYDPC